jgi:hypothetical protein
LTISSSCWDNSIGAAKVLASSVPSHLSGTFS